MSVFIIHPALTVGDLPKANSFFSFCRDELENHIDVTTVRTDEAVNAVRITKDDGIVVFNRADQNYPDAVLSLLSDALKILAEIFPVSCEPQMRFPAKVVTTCQSFDVVEQLRHRKLTEANIATVAVAFARTIVCRLQPTLSKEQIRLFISHRRFDGEEIAAIFYDQLKIRAEEVFRDLIDIRVGEDAQEVIQANLHQSDAIIFLDTPKAGKSEWIAIELQQALSMSLPIVWIKFGTDENRIALKVKPAQEPHFRLPLLPKESAEIAPTFIDEVIYMAFRISRQEANKVFCHIRTLKKLIETNGGEIFEEDRKNFLYRVRIARQGFRYAQRPLINLVQFYGRWPKTDDLTKFYSCAANCGYESHLKHGPAYDAALLLSPIPKQTLEGGTGDHLYVDSSEEYISELTKYVLRSKIAPDKRGVIISGAFPDCEPEYQQHLTNAVYSFVQTILLRRGTVIFGGHPTFQPLVFEVAKQRRPQDFKTAVRLYVSTYFVKRRDLSELRKHATTTATKSVKRDKDASLTIMRKAMIADSNAIALVAMGGKTSAERQKPGIDEEIKLAKQAGLPVFLIGAAGGRTAQIGAELGAHGWRDKPNNLSPQENEELLTSIDFGYMANNILDRLGI
jgi:hypothetical protein